MKIGILTLPLHTNYGGILQAYALQTVLERMGHEARLITGKPKMKPGVYGKLFPLKHIIKQIIPDRFSKDSCRYTNRFVEKWIKCDAYHSIEAILSDCYDAIIVGSDQIWRQLYVEKSLFLDHIESGFLDFTQGWNIKRISYAASFGTDEWEYDDKTTHHCAKLIKMFDAVSVREASGADLCKKKLNHEAVQLIDPTLLLSKEDYKKLITKKYRQQHGIMAYILDEDDKKLSLVDFLKEKTGKTVFKPNIPYNKLDVHARGTVQPPLERWLKSFEDADMVVTDSFHACVFSIIFNKPFIAIPNTERGASRFYSLLKMTNQEHRIIDISKPFELTDEMLSKPNCDISDYQKQSLDFLSSNLK